jgi:SAM-dependent MidA family methyltransferase
LSNALSAQILETIRRDGPMPFATFMAQALYSPNHGYYSSGKVRTGWAGHFVTSPELDPAFGALWARGFSEIWEATGTPDVFEVVEIGPGEGGFAAAVLSSVTGPFARALRYRLVERSPIATQRQREALKDHPGVTWVASLNEIGRIDQGVIIANEVLDNLPVHIVEQHAGHIQEIWVGEKDGRLVPLLNVPSNPDILGFLTRHNVSLRNGSRFEVGLAAETFVRQLVGLLNWGAVILIDYGATSAELMSRPEGTLVCYSSTGPDADPLESPGEKDITSHANWTAVASSLETAGAEVIGPLGQRDILVKLGLAEMDRALREEHNKAMLKGKGAEAVRILSRRQALGALADPGGLGGLQTIFGLKEIVAPRFMRF